VNCSLIRRETVLLLKEQYVTVWIGRENYFLPIKHVKCNAAAFRFNKRACGSEKTSIQSVLLWSSSPYTWVLRKRLTTKFSSPIGLHCVNCTRFGQLILRKIINTAATRCHIFSLKCINSISAGSPPQRLLGKLTQPLFGLIDELVALKIHQFSPSFCDHRPSVLYAHSDWSADSQENH